MKYRFLKKVLFKIVKFCPQNWMRVFIYRKLFKYSIDSNAYIGKSIIYGNKVYIGKNVTIKDGCIIKCDHLEIGNKVSILSGNIIKGKASFRIGENSRVINDHFIDLTNNVEIGTNTWLAGRRSQIWTHGSIHTKLRNKDLSVKIGNDIYIGSNSLIAPGVKICNLNLIGIGSVLTKSIESSNNIIAGNPATIVKKEIDWRTNW